MTRWKLNAFADEASSMIDQQIAAMKRNGLHGLEIRSVDGENISSITMEKAREVRKKMDDADLHVWSVGSPIGKIEINDPFEPHLELLRHTIDLAQVLGTQRIRMFSFYLPQGGKPQDYSSAVMDRMGRMLEVAKEGGAILCHENEKGIYGDVAVRCKELHETFPDLHGIFDPANYIQCGQDVREAWKLLKGYMDYLHIKDALADGSVVPAGKGIGSIAEIIMEYAMLGGEHLTIEPHLKVFDGLQALEREGEKTQLGAYVYETNDLAFDAACAALRTLL